MCGAMLLFVNELRLVGMWLCWEGGFVRYAWFGLFLSLSIEEVQGHATNWLWTYNDERIGGITPAQKLRMAA